VFQYRRNDEEHRRVQQPFTGKDHGLSFLLLGKQRLRPGEAKCRKRPTKNESSVRYRSRIAPNVGRKVVNEDKGHTEGAHQSNEKKNATGGEGPPDERIFHPDVSYKAFLPGE